MKFREDFVTNSSSASYIICFARIEDEDKAERIIKKFNLDVLTADDVRGEMWWGKLGADWASAYIYNADRVLKEYPEGKFVIIEDSNDAWEYFDDETFEDIIDYNYDFEKQDVIDAIISDGSGFADVEVSEGEGRNG